MSWSSPSHGFTKCGERLQTGRDENKCRQARRAAATLEIGNKEGKHDLGVKKGKEKHKKRKAES